MINKKILALIISVLLLFTLYGGLAASALDSEAVLLGDVDGDGEITAADARIALRFSSGLISLTEKQQNAADVDRIGGVTAADARIILRYSSRLISVFPVPSTKVEILTLYTEVVNKAKTDVPGYQKMQYQAVPNGTAEDRRIDKGGEITEKALKILAAFFVLENDAQWYTLEKGTDIAKWNLPVINNNKGCLLTDADFIRDAKCEVLPNDNWKITIILNDEVSPEPTPYNGSPLSKVGSLIYPISAKDVQAGIDSVPGLTSNSFRLTYRNTAVVCEFNPASKQIVTLDLIADISLDFDMTLTGVNLAGFQRIWDKVFFKDFVY